MRIKYVTEKKRIITLKPDIWYVHGDSKKGEGQRANLHGLAFCDCHLTYKSVILLLSNYSYLRGKIKSLMRKLAYMISSYLLSIYL